MKLQPYARPLLAMITCALMGAVQAAPTAIAITNGDFESNSVPDGSIAFQTTPVGWTASGASFGVYNPATSGAQYSAAGFSAGTGEVGTMKGATVAFMYLADGTYLRQTTAHDVVAGEVYQLTVALGGRTRSQITQGASIQLWDADSLLASLLVTDITLDTFQDRTLSYTAQATDSGKLSIRLQQAQGSYADFDNVRLSFDTAASGVPEPGTAALVGLAGLLALRNRRKA